MSFFALVLVASALADPVDPDAVSESESTAEEPAEARPATPEELVTEAWRRIDLADFEGARIVARQAIAGAPDAEVQARATAAVGAALELEGRPAEALPFYAEVLRLSNDPVLAQHMHFRTAESLGVLGRYDEARAALARLGDPADHPRLDALKIELLLGIWLVESGERDAGLKALGEQLAGIGPDEIAFHQAKARATVARALCDEAAELALEGRERKQVKRISQRATLIRAAEKQVVAAIELKEPEWALEGLLVLGAAYERVGDDMLALPLPRSVVRAGLEADYATLMHDRVEILWVKAGKHYDQGVDLAVRLDWRSRRIAQLEAASTAVWAKVDDL